MRFRLTPRSMTLDDLKLFEYSENLDGISQTPEATIAKRIKIQPV